jgi:hypothetical protein
MSGAVISAVGGVVAIANGVSNLFSDDPAPPPNRGGGGGGGGSSGGNASISGGHVGPPNLTATMTAPSTESTPIDLGGRFSAPTLYGVNAQRYFADGGPIDFEPVDEEHQGGLSATEHKPEFYSEGGLSNTYVKGKGDGTSDSVPAMLATGEFVIPSDIVSALGNGSNDSGSKVLDEFLQVIREHKHSNGSDKLPPDSKGPLEYISISQRKVNK